MINHVRTLLLNEKGSNSPGYPFQLEEYTPEAFQPQSMPGSCQKIWNLLFGIAPDRAYKNWRLHQLFKIAESSDLFSFWFDLDSRITHGNRDNLKESTNFDKAVVSLGATGQILEYVTSGNTPVVSKIMNSSNQTTSEEDIGLFVTGKLTADDAQGKCRMTWTIQLSVVEVGVSATVDMLCQNTNKLTSYPSELFTASLTRKLDLPGTGLKIQFRQPANETWELDLTARPALDVGTVLANIENTSGIDTDFVLTGKNPAFKTFKKYWDSSLELAEKITAISLGLAYKLEETRNK